VLNNILYFIANDGIHGNEVWRTDGTAAGTYMLFDIDRTDPVNVYNREDGISSFAIVGNELFYSAYDPSVPTRYVIVQSDGRPNVARVMMAPGPFIEMILQGDQLLLFGKESGSNKTGAWVVDVNNMGPGASLLSYTEGVWDAVDTNILNGIVYFSNREGGRMWRTNGQACGTFAISTGLTDHYPLEPVGTSMVFDGYALKTGNEPYVYRNITSVTSPCDAAPAMAVNEGSAEEHAAMSISPYPNPFASEFTLRADAEDIEVAEIEVFTQTGLPVETIRNVNLREESRIGGAWPRGTYILKIRTADGVLTQRLIKR
jgi:ELWxxDGT repeat protein